MAIEEEDLQSRCVAHDWSVSKENRGSITVIHFVNSERSVVCIECSTHIE